MIYIIDNDFDKLRSRLSKMLLLIEEQVDFTFTVLNEYSHELANLVIERDNAVDKHDTKIEKLCQKIYHAQTLGEEDTRFLMTVMPMVMNLERIGDIAENICRRCVKMAEREVKTDLLAQSHLSEMCRIINKMIKSMVQSVLKRDSDLAHNVRLHDVVVDRLNVENFIKLKDAIVNCVDNTHAAVDYILVSKDLERLADHATDIAEQVIFIVEAEAVRHKFAGDIR